MVRYCTYRYVIPTAAYHQNAGEYIRAIRVAPTNIGVIAACDGIYDANSNTTLLAKRQMKLETACFSLDVILANGYLNLFNIEFTCKLTGGVYKVPKCLLLCVVVVVVHALL